MFYKPPANCQIEDLGSIWERVFGQRAHGFFVEVGAYDGESFSNTSCLADVGWSGIYVEPIQEFADKCRSRHAANPGVRVVNVAAASEQSEVIIYIGDTLTTIRPEQVVAYSEIDWAQGLHKGMSRRVPTETLDAILCRENAPTNFDVLVVDVEGAELEVFAGFNIRHWQPKVMIVELEDKHPDFRNRPETVDRALALRSTIAAAGYDVLLEDHINTIFLRQDMFGVTQT